MIPLKLSLQGVYSYQNLVEIDFTQLMEDRLFGIFGPVGSGKSAILEAICYALYGQVERLDTSGRNYNMMNLRSDRLLIEFEFELGEGEDKKRYKYKVTGRRNSKNFDDVNTLKRIAYQWIPKEESGEWFPLESANATQVLGLSYEHFSKTIIIPQGKFQEFLHMTAGKRTSMLQDLFGLNRFDLAGPAGSLRKVTESELTNLHGQVKGLGEVDLEQVREKEKEILAGQEELKALETTLKGNVNSEQTLSKAKDTRDNFQEAQEALELMEKSVPDMLERKGKLERYTIADRYFKEKLEQQNLKNKELLSTGNDQAKLQQSLKEEEQKQHRLEASFAEIQKAFEKKEELIERSREMEKLSDILLLDQEIAHSNQRLVKGKASVDEQIQQQAKAREEATSLQGVLSTKRENLPDPNLLADLQVWFRRKADLTQRQKELEDSLAKHEADHLAHITKVQQLDWPDGLEPGIELAEALAATPKLQQTLGEQLQAESKHLVQAQTELRLVEFAGDLQQGNPCPLCGATDHPRPIASENHNEAVAAIERQIHALQNQRTALDQWLLQATRLNEQSNNLSRLKEQIQSQLDQQVEATQLHLATFAWPDFSPEKPELLEKALAEQKLGQNEILQLEKNIETARSKIDHTQGELDKYRNALQTIEQEVHQRQSRRLTLLEQLKHFSYDNHQGKRPEELRAKADFFQSQYETVTQRYQQVNQELTELKETIGSLKTNLQVTQSQNQRLGEEILLLQTELEERLNAHDFGDIEIVKSLLSMEIDIADEQETIRTFEEELAKVRHDLTNLQAKIADQPYEESEHLALKALIKDQEAEGKELSERLGSHQNQLSALRKRIEKAGVLLAKIDVLERRKSNLDLLAKLFRDKGFVKYVSSIYLIELSKRANERFRVLTRNQLSLEVQGDNEFILRDMLNGGKTRSVKTLSGGQTFQAALCLALALSENIQHNTPGNSNFFFLDEGFGTLDRDSLRIVFDTLKQLRRENRIVGIISHVEDLQQEIGMHLRIQKDDEKGSKIRGSWE